MVEDCRTCIHRRGDYCGWGRGRVIEGEWVETPCHDYLDETAALQWADRLEAKARRLRELVDMQGTEDLPF